MISLINTDAFKYELCANYLNIGDRAPCMVDKHTDASVNI